MFTKTAFPLTLLVALTVINLYILWSIIKIKADTSSTKTEVHTMSFTSDSLHLDTTISMMTCPPPTVCDNSLRYSPRTDQIGNWWLVSIDSMAKTYIKNFTNTFTKAGGTGTTNIFPANDSAIFVSKKVFDQIFSYNTSYNGVLVHFAYQQKQAGTGAANAQLFLVIEPAVSSFLNQISPSLDNTIPTAQAQPIVEVRGYCPPQCATTTR